MGTWHPFDSLNLVFLKINIFVNKKSVSVFAESFLRTMVLVRSSPEADTCISDIVPVLSKTFLDIQATTECRFTLNAYVIW